ncbi:MAG: D-alanyl-D-alanine carboxypeptidase family protein [Francisellaceae bacterium]
MAAYNVAKQQALFKEQGRLVLNLKKISLAALMAAAVVQFSNAETSPTTAETANTYGATSVNYMGVPLNPYGAVSSSAKVPLDIQVPAAPADLKLTPLHPATDIWKGMVVPAPIINAKSYMLVDAQSGNVLVAKDANQRMAPASLTKMMLLYIVEKQLASGALKLDQKVKVPAIAWHTAGSTMHLKAGQEVSIQDLIEGTIVASGNDAAVALAITIAGTQESFVNIMNFTAKQLGMTNTHFSDVMGLPAPNLYTSAHDLAILAHAIVYDYPEYYHFYKMKSVEMNGFVTQNYNKLLFIYPYADGIKTGSTDSAGFSLVSSAVKPDKDRLIAVVLGSTSLLQSARDSQALLEYGFSNFKTQTFYPKNYKLDSIRVYKGKSDEIAIGVKQAITVSYPAEIDPKAIQFVLHKNENGLIAPVPAGSEAGTLEMKYKDRVIETFPIMTLSDDPIGGLWQRVKGSIALWF